MENIQLRLRQLHQVGTPVAVIADEMVHRGGMPVLSPQRSGFGYRNPCRLGLAPPPFSTGGELTVGELR